MLPERKCLPHDIPSWVADGSEYFITICTRPHGKNQLCNAETAALIKNSFSFYQERGDLWFHLLLLMPDHLHAIVSFSQDVCMRKTISNLKKYITRNSLIIWQRDFFDHRLRHDESYLEKANYIRMNPVRAGLCNASDEWKYVWETN